MLQHFKWLPVCLSNCLSNSLCVSFKGVWTSGSAGPLALGYRVVARSRLMVLVKVSVSTDNVRRLAWLQLKVFLLS